MKKLKNIGKSLSRNEMRIVNAGLSIPPTGQGNYGINYIACVASCNSSQGYSCFWNNDGWLCSHP
jgi:hypothetical protein